MKISASNITCYTVSICDAALIHNEIFDNEINFWSMHT